MSSDNRFDKIEEKLDELKDKQGEMNGLLAVYNAQLEIHIQGTEDNRASIKEFSTRLTPIEDHIKFVRKFFIFVGSLLAIGVSLVQILEYFK